MDKAQRLVGDHADLIDDDSVDVPPVSSQLVKFVGTQLAVPGAATVFHGQVEALWMVRLPMLKAATPVGAISMQRDPAPRWVRSRYSLITLMM